MSALATPAAAGSTAPATPGAPPARGAPTRCAGSPPSAISVLVVAPHELVLCGMRSILAGAGWVRTCLLAQDAAQAAVLARRHAPTVALIDLTLEGASAAQACLAIRRAAPATRVLLLAATEHVPPRTVASIGAAGFVSKRWPSAAIIRALRLAARGLRADTVSSRPPMDLSARQHEILQLLAEGETNDAIARALHVSLNTVKEHASALYRKLGARNRAEAIGRAQAMGMLH